MINGVATSIYGTDVSATISLANLSSTGKNNTFVTRDIRFRVNPNNIAEIRAGMLKVGATIASFGDRAMSIARNSTIYPPLFVNLGTSQDSPHELYIKVLRNAFSEYSFPDNVSIHHLLYLLLYSLSQKNKLRKNSVVWNMNTYYAGSFTERGNLCAKNEQHDDDASRRVKTLLDGSKRGMKMMQGLLREFIYLRVCHETRRLDNLGVLEGTRFHQIGFSHRYFQSREVYSFIHESIGDVSLRDIYAAFFISHFRSPHNLCVKGPKSPCAPPLADINATHIGDFWDIIYHLSGTPISYGHVEARVL